MCGDCSNITLPGVVGPAGPQGPAGANGINGTNGTNGTNGADGADGADGVAVIEVGASDITTTATALPGTADISVTVPANTWDENQEIVSFEVNVVAESDIESAIFQIDIDGNQVSMLPTINNQYIIPVNGSRGMRLVLKFVRTGADEVTPILESSFSANIDYSRPSLYSGHISVSKCPAIGGLTFSSAMDIDFSMWKGSSAGGSVKAFYYEVTSYKK